MKIKKKLLRATMIVAAGLFLALFAQSAHASTVQVGTCKGPSIHAYATISDALSVVPAGTTIDVCPGYYAEQVTITTNNITLIGVTAASTSGTLDAAVVIPPASWVANAELFDPEFPGQPAVAQIAVIGATNVTISHIIVDGANNNFDCSTGVFIGIYYEDSTGTVTDSVARNQILTPALQGDQCGWGIAAESGAGTPSVTVSNSAVHNFQKNGILARGDSFGDGVILTATANTVIGVGATAAIAQNGIEVAFGATGIVKSNYVADVLYTGSEADTGATGILFYGATGASSAQSNVIESSNIGIGTYLGPGGASTITASANHIGGTQVYDGLDLCSNGNTAETNIIYASTESGIHLDDTCGFTGNTNTVKSNTINEACAGILTGSGTSGNVITPNTYENDSYETLAGDTCTPPAGPISMVAKAGKTAEATAKNRKARP